MNLRGTQFLLLFFLAFNSVGCQEQDSENNEVRPVSEYHTLSVFLLVPDSYIPASVAIRDEGYSITLSLESAEAEVTVSGYSGVQGPSRLCDLSALLESKISRLSSLSIKKVVEPRDYACTMELKTFFGLLNDQGSADLTHCEGDHYFVGSVVGRELLHEITNDILVNCTP